MKQLRGSLGTGKLKDRATWGQGSLSLLFLLCNLSKSSLFYVFKGLKTVNVSKSFMLLSLSIEMLDLYLIYESISGLFN